MQNQILNTYIWPTPFVEIIESIKTGVQVGWEEPKINNSRNIEWEWTNRLYKKLCFNSKCLSIFEKPPCRKEPEYEILQRLLPIASWCFLNDKDLDLKCLKKGFFQVESLKTIFIDYIDPNRLEGLALSRFFAHCFWNEQLPKIKNTYINSKSPFSQNNILKCLSSCSRIVLFINDGLSIDEKTIESLVWALEQYSHDILGIEPRLDISSHLLFAARNEPSLHVLRPYYRDHFFHVIEVCFLGHLLLETRINRTQTLVDLFRSRLGFKSNREVLCEWYVAALFHDIGYSVEILHGVKESLKFLKRSNKLNELTQGIDKLFFELSESLSSVNFESFTKEDKPGEDHGVVGAEHLRGLVEHISKSKPGIHDYAKAQRAIAVHNHHKKVVNFESDPLGFLLILCDTIQQWNRPHLHYATAPSTLLSRLYHGPSIDEKSHLTGPLSGVAINIHRQEDKFFMDDFTTLKIDLFYTEDINKNSNIFNLWLASTSNLQRLKLDKLPFNIKIQFITPPFLYEGKVIYQMQRLREAAIETHMNFLHDWFPGISNNRAILHTIKDPDYPDKEVLTIDLRELTKRQLMTASMKTFWNKLSHWRRFHEDREFSGDYAPSVPG